MKFGVVGSSGRMGQLLIAQILKTPEAELVGASAQPGSSALGHDAGLLVGADPCGVRVSDDPLPMFADADAVLDFTVPEATVQYAAWAAQGKTVHIIGTTGLDKDQEEALGRAARHTPIVYAANMSIGINLLLAMVERAAATVAPDTDIEIQEIHHRHKVDAPSGTALALGKAAAAGREVSLDDVAVFDRHGHTGARPDGAIGFAALRGGEIVGEHTAMFIGADERLELTHKATNRAIYAEGAVRAALWAYGKPPRIYGMREVLGIT
ncbi:MAG: 4-hydroxy-tetrahydrodipicolinate reductase [Pseudomonadota bacterium]